MIRFFGSFYFAIGLIGCTLLFVILGTFLESWTESHLFASLFTYRNPFFQLLFWLYFINILFAALSRFPFKKKHVPFLLTHLGLLLLLLGVFVKNHFGVQGNMILAEGCGSSSIFLPETYALHLENPKGSILVELQYNQLGTFKINEDLELSILDWTAHAEEKMEGFIKGGWGHIVGLPPFQMKKDAPTLHTPHYQIYAYKTVQYEKPSFPGSASLFFIQDDQDHLVAFNEDGECHEKILDATAYYVYNKGYGGYALFAELPKTFPPIELITPLTRSWQIQPKPLKHEEAIPLIRLQATSEGLSETIYLTYDKHGRGFKWPVLGKYLIRFQPNKREISPRLRLRSAKQINYPGTLQPYSYEATIWAGNEEAVLSMNHVYEKNGYRYYLANLADSPNGSKSVQIVVNHDPAKYILTYPGAIILAIGIILFYFQRRYV